MKNPKAIILSGYGLNCEEETKYAFELGGSEADIVHINDLIDNPKKLKAYQILAVPGGFSYGDDTGSGKAFANKMRNHLGDQISNFTDQDKLMIGICNGFQILTNLGLLPGALTFNDSNRYTDRWVDLKITSQSPWLRDIKALSLPIAHGEGKYFADAKTLEALRKNGQIAAVYVKGEISTMQNLPANPNGSVNNIAAVTSRDGRVLGIMPHPERAVSFFQLPYWTLNKEKLTRGGQKVPSQGPGMDLFRNAARYFTWKAETTFSRSISTRPLRRPLRKVPTALGLRKRSN
jgi:phosphoribosylformylglycinamidine synthase I